MSAHSLIVVRVTPRAPAMSPEDRRTAIVEVTIPLLREHGAAVTTKQVAEAAGIAEGTVFRAFGTKDELVQACAAAVFDTIRRRGRAARHRHAPARSTTASWPRSR